MAMNGGHNVLTMEKDAPQLKAMMANLRKYVPKSQLTKVVTVKELEDAKENPDGSMEFQYACGHCKALQEQRWGSAVPRSRIPSAPSAMGAF